MRGKLGAEPALGFFTLLFFLPLGGMFAYFLIAGTVDAIKHPTAAIPPVIGYVVGLIAIAGTRFLKREWLAWTALFLAFANFGDMLDNIDLTSGRSLTASLIPFLTVVLLLNFYFDANATGAGQPIEEAGGHSS